MTSPGQLQPCLRYAGGSYCLYPCGSADPVWDATPAIGPITCSEAESGTFTIPVLATQTVKLEVAMFPGSNGIITNTTFDACGVLLKSPTPLQGYLFVSV